MLHTSVTRANPGKILDSLASRHLQQVVSKMALGSSFRRETKTTTKTKPHLATEYHLDMRQKLVASEFSPSACQPFPTAWPCMRRIQDRPGAGFLSHDHPSHPPRLESGVWRERPHAHRLLESFSSSKLTGHLPSVCPPQCRALTLQIFRIGNGPQTRRAAHTSLSRSAFLGGRPSP